MRRKLLLIILVGLLGVVRANCQAPDWEWAKYSINYNTVEGTSVAVDSLENVYFTGFSNGTPSITFDSYVLANAAIFLAKYDSTGNLKWAKSATHISNNVNTSAFGVCTDRFGNCYISGKLTGSLRFDFDTLTATLGGDAYLVKYDSLGNVIWAKKSSSTGGAESFSAATDALGNIYITGFFSSQSIIFGPYTLTNAGGQDIFIAKYDSAGSVKWAKSIGGTGNDVAYRIAVDDSGNACITGFFESAFLTFDSDTLRVIRRNMFIAKYDSSGNVLWAKTNGGSNYTGGDGVTVDMSLNVYVTGQCGDTVSFGTDTLISSSGKSFLVKYDPTGNVLWAKSILGAAIGYGGSISADRNGKIYLDRGFTSPTMTFDTIILQNPGGNNNDNPMYIAGYNSSGNALFAKALATGGDDWNSVAAGPSGNIYIGGDFALASDTIILGNDSLLANNGSENGFVAKLSYPDIIKSISEINSTTEFIFYPNPFNDQLTVVCNFDHCIETLRPTSLQLFDIASRELFHCSFENSVSINTSNLARGVYIYEVRDEEGVVQRGKVVKE